MLARFIAWKYLRSRRTKAVSVITYISIIGIALGVGALIITLSIMNGFEKDLKNALIGANAHVTLQHFINTEGVFDASTIEQKLQNKQVKSYSRYIFHQALLLGSKSPAGALVRGIDLTQELQNKELVEAFKFKSNFNDPQAYETGKLLFTELGKKHLQLVPQRNFGNSTTPRKEELDPIVLGSILAKNLQVRVGETVRLMSPEAKISPFGPLPRMKKLKVVGIYQSGLSGYDEVLAFVSLPLGQKIFNMPNQYTAVAIYLQDAFQAEQVKAELVEKFEFPYIVRTWIEDNQNLFRVIALEKYGLAVILTLIILVASFNIVSSLIMLVQERKRDIALFKSLGMKDKDVQLIFIFQGLALGLVGTFAGIAFGWLICWLLSNFEVVAIPSGVYAKNRVPILIDYVQILFIASTSIVICLIVSYFPARRASKINPVDILRYE